jgi:hypothetical protein
MVSELLHYCISNFMKKLFFITCLALAATGRLSAVMYTDVNPADVRLDAVTGSYVYVPFRGYTWVSNPLYNPSYTGEWTLGGYNPAEETIVSASASFVLWDLIGSEQYSITFADIAIGGGSFSWFLSTGDIALSGNALLDLAADGSLHYTVTAQAGQFWLKEASLTAYSAPILPERDPQRVPDTGATLALLGASVAAIIGLRRKISA